MTPKNTYIVDRILHWLSASTIIFLLLDMGTRIHNIDYRIKGAVQHKQDAISLHFTIALVLFITLLLRLAWYKFYLDKQYQLTYESTAHKWIVRTIHTAMYLSLFLLMCTGVLMVSNYEHPLHWFGLFSIATGDTESAIFFNANNWHIALQNTVYFLVAVHVLGAMYNKR